MEFDDMKKIWDTQNNEPLYAVNETALHHRILSKKRRGFHITNISEWLSVLAYGGAGCFILGTNLYKQSDNVWIYVLAAWMLVSALYTLVSRIRRIRGELQFDRSMTGDLAHAISVAAYQVRLSFLMRWNILPVGLLTVLSVLGNGKSVWVAVGVLVFLMISYYASGWEHNIYKNRKRELEVLQNKLEGV